MPGSYTVHPLPVGERNSSRQLWGLKRGNVWVRWPAGGPMAWFITKALADRYADRENGATLLVSEQPPRRHTQADSDAVSLVDADGVTAVLHSADGSVVDPDAFGELHLGQAARVA